MPVSSPPWSLFRAVLDSTEASLCVVDEGGRAVFMNPSAKRLLQADTGFPPWVYQHLTPMLAHVATRGTQCVEKWVVADVTLRVRIRPLTDSQRLSLMEVDVAHPGHGQRVEQTLSRALGLSITEARMLACVWRGLSNDGISLELRLKLGTVKSRLSRLYRRLGVKHRSGAVLCAADALS